MKTMLKRLWAWIRKHRHTWYVRTGDNNLDNPFHVRFCSMCGYEEIVYDQDPNERIADVL